MTRTWRSLLMVWLTLCCIFVFAGFANAQRTKTGMMYLVDNPTVTIAWDAVSGAIGYQMQLVMFDKLPVTILVQADTSETSITLSRPRSGQFVAKVRSWNWKIGGEEKRFSEWAMSDNPEYATVNGQPGAWWIYWLMPTPEIEVD